MPGPGIEPGLFGPQPNVLAFIRSQPGGRDKLKPTEIIVLADGLWCEMRSAMEQLTQSTPQTPCDTCARPPRAIAPHIGRAPKAATGPLAAAQGCQTATRGLPRQPQGNTSRLLPTVVLCTLLRRRRRSLPFAYAAVLGLDLPGLAGIAVPESATIAGVPVRLPAGWIAI